MPVRAIRSSAARDVVQDAFDLPFGGGFVLDQVGVGQAVEQTAFGCVGQVAEVGPLELQRAFPVVGRALGPAVAVSGPVFFRIRMDRAEDVVEVTPCQEPGQPRLVAGEVVALQTEQDVDPAGPGLAGAVHQGQVVVELGFAHPPAEVVVVAGVRAVAGDHDSAQVALFGHGGVVFRLAAGMFAKRVCMWESYSRGVGMLAPDGWSR
jgi:hypothetical protein